MTSKATIHDGWVHEFWNNTQNGTYLANIKSSSFFFAAALITSLDLQSIHKPEEPRIKDPPKEEHSTKGLPLKMLVTWLAHLGGNQLAAIQRYSTKERIPEEGEVTLQSYLGSRLEAC